MEIPDAMTVNKKKKVSSHLVTNLWHFVLPWCHTASSVCSAVLLDIMSRSTMWEFSQRIVNIWLGSWVGGCGGGEQDVIL